MDAEIGKRQKEIADLFVSGVTDLKDKYEELIPLLEARAQDFKTKLGARSARYADALLEVATYQRLVDRTDIAERLSREALQIHTDASGAKSLPVANALMAFAGHLAPRSHERGGALRSAFEIRSSRLGNDDPLTHLAASALVSWLREENRHSEADAIDNWLQPKLEAARTAFDDGGIPYEISWRRLRSHFPQAFKDAAIGYAATPFLIMSAISTADHAGRLFGIAMPPSSQSGLQQAYEFTRDGLFSGVSVLVSFAGIAMPGWLKDFVILYGKVSSALAGALKRLSVGPTTHATGVRYVKHWISFTLGHYLTIAWACAVWPIHFIGFAMKWLDPLKTYRRIGSLVLTIGTRTIPAIGRGAFVEWTAPYFIANIVTLAVATSVVLLLRAYAL